jgi:hypothetical protein
MTGYNLNILITGPTGAGKSFIACALGHKACLEGYRVPSFRSSRLFQDLCRRRSGLGLSDAYDIILRLRKLLRSEILRYIRTKRTRAVTGEQLRELIAASTLFVPANEDVLQGLRTVCLHHDQGPLYQNAVAETLSVRIPRYIEGLISPDPQILREKFLMKLYKFGLSSQQRLALSAYLPREASKEELTMRLERIKAISRKLSIDGNALARLLHFIDSQRRLVLSVNHLYQGLFLDPALIEMRKLYAPGKVMVSTVTSWNTFTKKFTFVSSLSFYPRKDWLEFAKSTVSSDCSHSELGRQQLLTSHFFNIRVFENDKWIGNVYCLDFTERYGYIIIDRIQIPRNIQAKYIKFFDGFREVLEEIFADVDYHQILVPLAISNNATIQKIFHSYRKFLPVAQVKLHTSYTKFFESLRHPRRLHILCTKKKEETDNLLREAM